MLISYMKYILAQGYSKNQTEQTLYKFAKLSKLYTFTNYLFHPKLEQ